MMLVLRNQQEFSLFLSQAIVCHKLWLCSYHKAFIEWTFLCEVAFVDFSQKNRHYTPK